MSSSARAAFVTGGTRGIGLAVARLLARRGYHVTVCGASQESVTSCRKLVASNGPHMEVLRIDVRDTDALAAGIAQAAGRAGRLDALVCCAGRPVLGDALNLSLDDWDRCLDLNLRTFFAAAKKAIPEMTAGGSVVFVSSIWSQTASRDRVAYVTAKTALTGLARALAVDHAAAGIRVNCVAPGYVETDLLRSSLSHVTDDVDGEIARIAARHPLGRLVAPDDVAQAVAFLAGDEAHSITGQTLTVDGGVTIRFALPE